MNDENSILLDTPRLMEKSDLLDIIVFPIEKLDPIVVIAFLNSLVKIDKDAISNLINYKVPCNDLLSKHETVQVASDENGPGETGCKVGLLGILNGLCGIDENSYGFIVAEIDEDNKVIRFIHSKDKV